MEDCILIFRTSIVRKQDVKRVGTLLAKYPQIHKWNVDFEDWEKVLRVECLGMHCERLIFVQRSWNKMHKCDLKTNNSNSILLLRRGGE